MLTPASEQVQGIDAANVLIADDDDEFREAMAEIIASEGWQVWQARDGEEAVRCTLSLRPDVLVLDQRMPAMTGVEVVRRLRDEGIRIPVVFVSAAHEIRELAASIGVRCHLRKPFGFDELTEMLRRATRGNC